MTTPTNPATRKGGIGTVKLSLSRLPVSIRVALFWTLLPMIVLCLAGAVLMGLASLVWSLLGTCLIKVYPYSESSLAWPLRPLYPGPPLSSPKTSSAMWMTPEASLKESLSHFKPEG